MVENPPPSFPVKTAEREGAAATTEPRDVTLMRRGMPGAKVYSISRIRWNWTLFCLKVDESAPKTRLVNL